MGQSTRVNLLSVVGARRRTYDYGAGRGAAARAYVADVLSRLDVTAALELAATVAEDEYRDKTYGRIASRIATRQPAEAETALDRIRDPYRRDDFYVRV